MRLVLTLLVRDEADIIATSIDYHRAQGVDHVIAMDNGSTDGTREILTGYADRGELTLVDGADEPFDQSLLVSRLARAAATEHGADWVINADADEFFWPRSGTLADVLSAVPPDAGTLAMIRNDFPPAPGEGPFWERMTVRETVSVGQTGHRLVPKVAHRGSAEVVVADGNHAADGAGLDAAPFIPAIEVLHFPYRDLEQATRKAEQMATRRRISGVHRQGEVADHMLLGEFVAGGTFAAWFAERRVADAAAAGSGGRLVTDTRLRDFLREGIERRAPDPAATAVLADEFAQAAIRIADLERAAVVVADLAASLDERLTAARAALEATEANLAAERAAHYETAEALRLLRDSRAVRLAHSARRVIRPGR